MSRTSRNNKQKGRKHRRVNRTPRPVTPVDRRTDRVVRKPAHERVAVRAAGGTSMVAARTAPVTVDDARPAADVERASADGLSRHARRTLTCLHDSGSPGATTEDLSEAVGFTARTVAKHLDGLSRCGLVEQRTDGRWAATDAHTGMDTRTGTEMDRHRGQDTDAEAVQDTDPRPGAVSRETSLPSQTQNTGAEAAVTSDR